MAIGATGVLSHLVVSRAEMGPEQELAHVLYREVWDARDKVVRRRPA